MPPIEEYVKRLNELRKTSNELYLKTLNDYKVNYPDFYKQLMSAMNQEPAAKSKISLFFSEYKWYLTAIGVGIIIIIFLLFLLFNR